MNQVKLLTTIAFAIILAGCDGIPESTPIAEPVESNEPLVGSFQMRNAEIRGEMLVEFEKEKIRHWINEDGSIGYFLDDGDRIDKIGNLLIGEYIARN